MSFFEPAKRLVPLARSSAYLSTSGSNESRKLFEAEVTTSGRAAKGHRCAGLRCRWPARTHYSWCGWRCSPVREVRVELLIVHRVAVGAADLDHGGGQARRHGERAAAQVRDMHRRQERVALHGDCRERSCQEAKHLGGITSGGFCGVPARLPASRGRGAPTLSLRRSVERMQTRLAGMKK